MEFMVLWSNGRSLWRNHSPLPGITVGDIGLKFGHGAYNTMDNGVLRFDHVRIPRDHMLMRVSQVTKEGKFVQSDVPRQLIYGTMVSVRQTIVADASKALSRAVFVMLQIIRVCSDLVSEWLKSLNKDVKQKLEAKDFSTLPEAHACTAGLKSLTTAATADGIEECRKLCGGHGYLINSGLPELFAYYVPACTYEGENVVMMLQIEVARFLMKTVSELGYKKPLGTTAYMGRVKTLMQSNCVIQTCFAELSADLVEASLAHCQLIVVSKFFEKLQHEIPGKGVKQLLEVLCYVYALFLLHKHQGDFLATGYLTPKQASLANDQLRTLYSQVRPNAIALVDSFNHTDHYLSSILGRYDGNVYPKLYEAAFKDPFNDSDISWCGINQYFKQILSRIYHC
ncbi:peroxisomal acyl-coenzyme A oxidase 1, partial [Tanacetum coccineum]